MRVQISQDRSDHWERAYQNPSLNKFSVTTAERKFMVNRACIIAASSYFADILMDDTLESAPLPPDVRPEDFELILSYLYTGRLEVENEQLWSLTKAANVLSIKDLNENLAKKIGSMLDVINCFDMFRQADELSLELVLQHCREFIKENIDQLIDRGEMALIPYDVISFLLSGNENKIKIESVKKLMKITMDRIFKLEPEDKRKAVLSIFLLNIKNEKKVHYVRNYLTIKNCVDVLRQLKEANTEDQLNDFIEECWAYIEGNAVAVCNEHQTAFANESAHQRILLVAGQQEKKQALEEAEKENLALRSELDKFKKCFATEKQALEEGEKKNLALRSELDKFKKCFATEKQALEEGEKKNLALRSELDKFKKCFATEKQAREEAEEKASKLQEVCDRASRRHWTAEWIHALWVHHSLNLAVFYHWLPTTSSSSSEGARLPAPSSSADVGARENGIRLCWSRNVFGSFSSFPIFLCLSFLVILFTFSLSYSFYRSTVVVAEENLMLKEKAANFERELFFEKKSRAEAERRIQEQQEKVRKLQAKIDQFVAKVTNRTWLEARLTNMGQADNVKIPKETRLVKKELAQQEEQMYVGRWTEKGKQSATKPLIQRMQCLEASNVTMNPALFQGKTVFWCYGDFSISAQITGVLFDSKNYRIVTHHTCAFRWLSLLQLNETKLLFSCGEPSTNQTLLDKALIFDLETMQWNRQLLWKILHCRELHTLAIFHRSSTASREIDEYYWLNSTNRLTMDNGTNEPVQGLLSAIRFVYTQRLIRSILSIGAPLLLVVLCYYVCYTIQRRRIHSMLQKMTHDSAIAQLSAEIC